VSQDKQTRDLSDAEARVVVEVAKDTDQGSGVRVAVDNDEVRITPNKAT
jgi:hypothetical protein